MLIKKTFISGIKAFIPIALTITITIWFFKTIETFFESIITSYIPNLKYFTGLGILVGSILVFILGIVTNAWLISHFYRYFDQLIKKIPIIKYLYIAIHDLVNFFDKNKSHGQKVVLVETPVGQMIGLVTRENTDNLPLMLGNQVYVYLPFSYQIGGFTILIEPDKLTPLDITVEKAMSLILTGAMTGQGGQPST